MWYFPIRQFDSICVVYQICQSTADRFLPLYEQNVFIILPTKFLVLTYDLLCTQDVTEDDDDQTVHDMTGSQVINVLRWQRMFLYLKEIKNPEYRKMLC